MKEEKIYIKNGFQIIEALFCKAPGESGVVICHPHSLMGGSMYNNVVETIQETFSAKNISTVRFNFRGVGESTGYYDEGRGEQDDVISVCNYMKESGKQKLLFAGYSFGAWVGSKIIEENSNPFTYSICVAPPIEYFDFHWNKLKDKIDLIVCGDADPFCDLNVLKAEAEKINTPIMAVPGADHFYAGHEKALAKIIIEFIVKKNIIKL